MVDVAGVIKEDAFSWWWERRTRDSHLPSMRRESAMRIVEAVYSSSGSSLPAFRALVEEAASEGERMDVVEAFFEFLPWERDTDGKVRAWLDGVARDEPELRHMVATLASRI